MKLPGPQVRPRVLHLMPSGVGSSVSTVRRMFVRIAENRTTENTGTGLLIYQTLSLAVHILCASLSGCYQRDYLSIDAVPGLGCAPAQMSTVLRFLAYQQDAAKGATPGSYS